jgi:hypothetical protein
VTCRCRTDLKAPRLERWRLRRRLRRRLRQEHFSLELEPVPLLSISLVAGERDPIRGFIPRAPRAPRGPSVSRIMRARLFKIPARRRVINRPFVSPALKLGRPFSWRQTIILVLFRRTFIPGNVLACASSFEPGLRIPTNY